MVNGEGSTRGILTSAAPLEGPLKLRKTGIGSKWSKRWFVLEGQSLHYYRRRPVNEKDIAVGSVNLWDVKDVTIVDADISVRFNDTQAGFRSAGMSHKSLGETAWRYATLRKSVPEADIALQLRCKDSNEAQMWVNGMFSTALKGQAQRASTEEGGIRKLVP
uniref:PH domain-containing protein n=1 Tax=Mucochytrium quahogii TaxID=96639 RepID=A0A7S2WHU8_9STRA|mmetsp:Transcript_23571/g.51223  ORF Transcript_23571/g.51223 Transcript_23571/m.51223 type:complete len:162 (+) Transcript_23571:288-773(+)